MAAQNSSGNEPDKISRLKRRLVIAVSIPIVIWTVIDEFYPNFFTRIAKTATIIGNMQADTIKAPATVEIGSLLVTPPKGEMFVMRIAGPNSPWSWSTWKPSTSQWAHSIDLRYNEFGLDWNDQYYPSVKFIMSQKSGAAAQATTCTFRSMLRHNGDSPGTSEPTFKLFSAFRRVSGDSIELLVPREPKQFLGQELVFTRIKIQIFAGQRPYLQTSIAITSDVNLELGISHDDIDIETFWAVISKIEDAIKPMLRRIDGQPLSPPPNVAAQCDAHHAAESTKRSSAR